MAYSMKSDIYLFLHFEACYKAMLRHIWSLESLSVCSCCSTQSIICITVMALGLDTMVTVLRPQFDSLHPGEWL